ncbi:FAD:protein FMN transferase [Candidatus Woesearchaeota archaeon]|nr:FAD:protein FMN transferase [Candidatus Woesearchaeota archaeon]
MAINLDIDEALAVPYLDEIYQLALRLQKKFNFYDPQSELSILNAKRSLAVSPELLYVLEAAITYSTISGGTYDISLGKQIKERKHGDEVTPVACTYRDIKIIGKQVTLTHKDVLIDLGSIAKGYIADRMIAFIKDAGLESAYIDARGDIANLGSRTVGIAHPRDGTILHTIRLDDTSVATSGDYKQYQGDYENSHILGKNDTISATVISPSLMEADAIATLLMVSKDIQSLMRSYRLPALIMHRDQRIEYFNDFKRVIQSEN